ncbi:MAG: hypothetical protein ACTSRG_21910 [Candidatus Helarchaeota archaeon]
MYSGLNNETFNSIYIQGSTNKSIVTLSSTDSPYTITDNSDNFIVDSSSGDVIINLPETPINGVRQIKIRKTSNLNTIQIVPYTGETVNSDSIYIIDDISTIVFINDGTDFKIDGEEKYGGSEIVTTGIEIKYNTNRNLFLSVSYPIAGDITLTCTFNDDVKFHGEKGSKVYESGTNISVNSTPVSSGMIFYYLDSDWNLVVDSSFPSFDIVSIATIYFNTTTNLANFVNYEIHTCEWPNSLHRWAHYNSGMIITNGDGDIAYNIGLGSPSGDENLKIYFNDTTLGFFDEDIQINVLNLDRTSSLSYHFELNLGTNLTSEPAILSVYYLFGSSDIWTHNHNTVKKLICLGNETTPAYPYYNQWNGSAWVLTEIATNKFCVYYVVGSTCIDCSIFLIMGQDIYSTLSGAQDTNFSNLQSFSTFSNEMKPIYKIIIFGSASYSSPTYKAKIIEVEDIRDHSVISGHASISNIHSDLSNLGYDSSGHTGFQRITTDINRIPTVDDDDSNTNGIGYNIAIGHIWYNNATEDKYISIDVSTGAAKWDKILTLDNTTSDLDISGSELTCDKILCNYIESTDDITLMLDSDNSTGDIFKIVNHLDANQFSISSVGEMLYYANNIQALHANGLYIKLVDIGTPSFKILDNSGSTIFDLDDNGNLDVNTSITTPLITCTNFSSTSDIILKIDSDNSGGDVFKIINHSDVTQFSLTSYGRMLFYGNYIQAWHANGLYIKLMDSGAPNFKILNSGGSIVFDLDDNGNLDVDNSLTVPLITCPNFTSPTSIDFVLDSDNNGSESFNIKGYDGSPIWQFNETLTNTFNYLFNCYHTSGFHFKFFDEASEIRLLNSSGTTMFSVDYFGTLWATQVTGTSLISSGGSSNSNYEIRLDQDGGSTSFFKLNNGANDTVFTISESGDIVMDGYIDSNKFTTTSTVATLDNNLIANHSYVYFKSTNGIGSSGLFVLSNENLATAVYPSYTLEFLTENDSNQKSCEIRIEEDVSEVSTKLSLYAEGSEGFYVASGGKCYMPNLSANTDLAVNISASTGQLYYVSSVRKDKKNITDMSESIRGIDLISKMKVKKYQRKIEENGKFELGMIAEDLNDLTKGDKELNDMFVSRDSNENIKGYREGLIKFILIDAFQEQQKEIEMLKKKNIELENKINEIMKIIKLDKNIELINPFNNKK